MPRLSDDEIQQALASLPGWAYDEGALRREFTLPGFREAVAFVNLVADVAERANHHPDILIRYNRVGITLSTHDAGGVTQKDAELARQITAVAQG